MGIIRGIAEAWMASGIHLHRRLAGCPWGPRRTERWSAIQLLGRGLWGLACISWMLPYHLRRHCPLRHWTSTIGILRIGCLLGEMLMRLLRITREALIPLARGASWWHICVSRMLRRSL